MCFAYSRLLKSQNLDPSPCSRFPSADHNDIAPHRARVAYQLQHALLMLSLASAFGGFFFYHMTSHVVRPNLPPPLLRISALHAPLALVQPRAQACR